MKHEEIEYTPEQLAAIAKLEEFVTAMYTDSWYFVFKGFAGTGKTTCMRRVTEIARKQGLKIEYTAPTNKAAKVLRGVVGKAVTTYSFLNLRVMKNGATKEIAFNKRERYNYSRIDVVVVDEGSMVNKELFRYLKEGAERFKYKVVFMGDPAQLPPVNETSSPALTGPIEVTLTKVMRHDNQILTFATHVREQIESDDPFVEMRNDNDGEEGVWVLDRKDFREMIFHAAREGEFDGETSKIIAWRNARVKFYNDLARIAKYGDKAVPGYFLPGEMITVGSLCMWGEDPLMNTDDDGIILNVSECEHPKYTQFKTFKLRVQPVDTLIDVPVDLYKIHPDSLEEYQDHVAWLADEAKKAPKLWADFWEIQDYFHDVRYSYAVTAHKAQGSTYRYVYVDSEDIMQNRNEKEALSCLYVGSTRPTTRLFLT